MSDSGRTHARIDHTSKVGELPKQPPARLWGGPATGAPCAICGVPTTSGSLELELEFTGDSDGQITTYRVHLHCFSTFRLEGERPVAPVDDGFADNAKAS